MSGLWLAAFVALWFAVVVLAVVLLGLVRRVSGVLERAEALVTAHTSGSETGGARPGTRIPAFAVFDKTGTRVTLGEALTEPALYLLMSSACEPCLRLTAQLEESSFDVPLFVIFDDSPASRRFSFGEGVEALYQRDSAAADAFRTAATPQLYAVDATSTVLDWMTPASVADVATLAKRLTEGVGSSSADGAATFVRA